MSLESLPGSSIQYHESLPFLRVRRSLPEMHHGNVSACIGARFPSLAQKGVKKLFPRLYPLQNQDLLFCDIETVGLNPLNPIATIALLRVNSETTLDCLVARNYSEEAPMLGYFLEQAECATAFITYNGTSFDLTRLSARLQTKGLFNGGAFRTDFKKHIRPRHYDLYSAMRGYRHMRDKKPGNWKLQTVEKYMFHEERDQEIGGEDIGPVYTQFVRGAASPQLLKKYRASSIDELMERVIVHNLKDSVTVLALFTYLCTLNHA